ncbi:MAG TPA: hypothetical protein VEU96_00600 [Bryobacteraceae bacterium]|nr:hypothetical protein [Bryobacteraceae bacterium]
MARKDVQHFWDGNAWHEAVHHHFGETLNFFLLRVRPFEPDRVKLALEALCKEHRLASVRGYRIFGQHDVLIRAWLHASLVERFRRWLEHGQYIAGVDRLLHFSVDDIGARWYFSNPSSPELRLLRHLGPDKIQKIEDGLDPELYHRARQARLIAVRERKASHKGRITFFVTLKFPGAELDLTKRRFVVSQLKEFFNDNADFKYYAVDYGHGFCDFIVKAEVSDFFRIQSLPNWIGETFKGDGASTETYLSHSTHEIFGNTRLSPATFDELKGQDLFARSILPEMYPKSSDTAEEIEQYLTQKRNQDISSGARNFLHDFLLGAYKRKSSHMAAVLYQFCRVIERYLRENHEEYLGRLHLDRQQIYARANISRAPDKVTLTDLFAVYTIALTEQQRPLKVTGGWQRFVDLRNDLAHANDRLLMEWKESADTVLAFWQYLSILLKEIESVIVRHDDEVREFFAPDQ